jgi:hypothetical protein
MTASQRLLIATAVAVLGVAARADDDVTVVPAPTTAPAPAPNTTTADGSPVIHKSMHKKHAKATAAANGTTPATTPAMNSTVYSKTAPAQSSIVVGPAAVNGLPLSTQVVPLSQWQPAPTTYTRVPPPATVTPVRITTATVSIPVPAVSAPVRPPDLSPAIETGLPVAKYSGINSPIQGVSTYIPTTTPLPNRPIIATVTGSTTHQPYYASILPASVIPLNSNTAGSYSSPSRTTSPPPDFVFTNFSKRTTVSYPWKRDIITTEFWIGEGGSSISATDNIGSAWDENWRTTNRGSDNPDDRNGFASADHASTVNPFYVALPFNDLAYPDKAREYVPRAWHRPNEDGKQVSACKDRWICIKNANGRVCYAQWEDVGPLRSDHAEYVFGRELPDTYTRAGLDISPAVAQYLGIDGNRRAITSWKFVDDDDVPPGQWLKYDEQAVIFTAMHQFRSAGASDLPIQKASEPIDDQNAESNKKRIDQSKG